MSHFYRFVTIIMASVLLLNCGSLKPKKKSLDNLRVAFNNESLGAEKYEKYSQAALNEGYDTLAQLFKAISKSERIHATNFGKLIEVFGQESGAPETSNFEVKSTRDNLKSAIKTATFEMFSIYPGFIKTSEKEMYAEIARGFTLANNCEKKYIPYLRKADLIIVKGNQSGIPFTYYVCSGCGNIYSVNDLPLVCDLCLTRQENFIGFLKKTD